MSSLALAVATFNVLRPVRFALPDVFEAGRYVLNLADDCGVLLPLANRGDGRTARLAWAPFEAGRIPWNHLSVVR